MNAALGLGILALALQSADKPELPTNMIPTNVAAIVTQYMPDAAYAGATATGEALTYVGGASWQAGRKWGIGAEYRQWRERVSFARQTHSAITHVAGPYLYRELPPQGAITIRTEAGAGVLWADSGTLQVSSTWVATIRASGRIAIAENIDLMLWFGAVRISATSVSDGRATGRIPTTYFPETGVALRLKF